MREFILQLNCCFSDEDKERCKPTIYRMVELATLTRAQGILRLEAEIGQEENFFLKTGIKLVVDGRMPETVEQILQNLILADRYTGWQLLDRLLITEGVLAIQRGESPYTIRLVLSSMLGEKHMLSIEEATSNQGDRIESYFSFLNTIRDKKAMPESEKFEAIILGFDNRSIQQIIQCTGISSLLMAISGCGAVVINKVLNNVSLTTALQICEGLEGNGSWQREAVWAQNKILETIDELIKQGNIIKINW